MERTTIDFGIDLGTTNSGIAILQGTSTEILKNNVDSDITPSAVFIDKRGIHVGQRAKQRQEDERSVGDTYTEFKLRMGSNYQYEFKTSRCKKNPEELSAEVLKSLRGDVQQRLGEDIHAAVITVPAVFEQKQCAATRRAAELAGLSQSPLLQEPVAAALAYGFQADVKKEFWCVYDFGGGTFDVAVMKAEDGTINVVNHGGDNSLGGSHIDWAIVEQLIIPELIKNYDLIDFSRGNVKWRTALAVIKRAAENAKIQLSRSDIADLEDCRIKDAKGKEIEVEFTLKRDALIRVAEPIIMRSVEISKRVLKERNLSPKAIEKMILVGGPTLSPYFREILHSNLGIQLDHSVDPLTVVARGAAIFAGTQRLETRAIPRSTADQYDVKLIYKTMGVDQDPQVRGAVKSPGNTSVAGFTVEFINRTDGAKDLIGWRSGKILLRADGKFKLRLSAEKGVRNTYDIELLDPHGSKRTIVPDTVVYTITGGAGVISEQPMINSIAVALANNETQVFFNKGGVLPAKKTIVLKTARALRKGESGDVLKVPIVEGENEKADHNPLLGSLEIRGASIRRDLPAGTEIEVTLIIDASRILTAKAYVPMLDEEFEAVIQHDKRSPDHLELKKQFSNEESRYEEMVVKVSKTGSENLTLQIEEIEESGKLEEIGRLLDAARGDHDASIQAEKRLLDLRVNLDNVEDLLKWPVLVNEANQAIDALDELIESDNMPERKQEADKLRKQTEELISQKRIAPLKKKINQIKDIYHDILFEQPSFWVGYFKYLEKQRFEMLDTDISERLFNQGYQYIQQENIVGLRNVVVQLLDQLPNEIVENIKRGYESGVLK